MLCKCGKVRETDEAVAVEVACQPKAVTGPVRVVFAGDIVDTLFYTDKFNMPGDCVMRGQVDVLRRINVRGVRYFYPPGHRRSVWYRIKINRNSVRLSITCSVGFPRCRGDLEVFRTDADRNLVTQRACSFIPNFEGL